MHFFKGVSLFGTRIADLPHRTERGGGVRARSVVRGPSDASAARLRHHRPGILAGRLCVRAVLR